MPLVPIIPETRRQKGPATMKTERLPQSYGQQVPQALSQSAARINQIVQRRMEERDIARARDGFNNFRRDARNRMNELRQLRGADAAGSQQTYDEWYSEAIGNFTEGFDNDRQRTMFQELASSKLESDANTMGAHELQQNFVYIESVYQDTKSSYEAEIANDPFNDQALQDAVLNTGVALEAARPGMDNGAEMDKAVSDFVITAVQAQLRINPLKAQATLENYKDELGAAYDGLKDEVDSESILVEAKANHPTDFDDRYDYIQNKEGISETVRATALGRVNSAQAESIKREKIAQVERRRVAENGVYEALTQGKAMDARRLIDSLPQEDWTEREKYGLYKLTQSKTIKSDPVAEKTLQVAIMTGEIKDTETLLGRTEIESLTASSVRTLGEQLSKYTKGSDEEADLITRGSMVKAIIQSFDRITAPGTELEAYRAQKPIFMAEFKTQMDQAEVEKGAPLTPEEIQKIGYNLLRTRVMEVPWYRGRDKEFRRVMQIIDPEKYPPELQETVPGIETPTEPQQEVAAGQPGLRGAPQSVREKAVGREPKAPQKKAVKSPESQWFESLDPAIKTSIINAVKGRNEKLGLDKIYYRDMWMLYKDKFPEEAQQIEQAHTEGGM